jgi:hypothetical protein
MSEIRRTAALHPESLPAEIRARVRQALEEARPGDGSVISSATIASIARSLDVDEIVIQRVIASENSSQELLGQDGRPAAGGGLAAEANRLVGAAPPGGLKAFYDAIGRGAGSDADQTVRPGTRDAVSGGAPPAQPRAAGRYPWDSLEAEVLGPKDLPGGIAFIPKNEIPSAESILLELQRTGARVSSVVLNHVYFKADPFRELLRSNPRLATVWSKLVRKATADGLLTADGLRLSAGALHTGKGVAKAGGGEVGYTASRSGYVGGWLFAKGWGMGNPGRRESEVPFVPKADQMATHRIWGGAQWDILETQAQNHWWMHAVTMEAFGELATTVLPLRLTPLSGIRTESGEIVETVKLLADEERLGPKTFRELQDRMKHNLSAYQSSVLDAEPSPESVAVHWMAHNRPTEMTCLFPPVQRDLSRISPFKKTFLDDSATLPAKMQRMAALRNRATKVARDHGAWGALSYFPPHMANPDEWLKDTALGYLADLDYESTPWSHSNWGWIDFDKLETRLTLNQQFIENLALQFLTREDLEAPGVREQLMAECRESFVEGFRQALEKIVFSDRPTDTMTDEQRSFLRSNWQLALQKEAVPQTIHAVLAAQLARFSRHR